MRVHAPLAAGEFETRMWHDVSMLNRVDPLKSLITGPFSLVLLPNLKELLSLSHSLMMSKRKLKIYKYGRR